MKDTFNSETRRDFSQRYRGCYAWFLSGDKRILTMITDVNDISVHFKDKDDMTYSANINSGAEWEFTQVERGWHLSDKGEAIYLYRIPRRQFSRGINSDNTGAYILTDRLRAHDLTYDVVESCFNNTYSKSVDDIAVLSKHFAKNKKQVYMFDIPVGTVDGTSINMTNPLFRQELSDIIRRNQLPLVIK